MEKSAVLYRMATDTHICPFGLKAKHLLKRKGYTIDDRLLASRTEADNFKNEHKVQTTPQVFIGNKRIGGYSDLRHYFHMRTQASSGKSYQPLYAIFITTALLAIATMYLTSNYTLYSFMRNFISLSMCLLAVLKLKDINTFTNGFLGYDLLAQRYVPYATMYPFLEGIAGLLMFATLLPILASTIALVIGIIGTTSVIKAVYIDRRELTCACVGGNSNVPLGAISLIENLMMIVMAIWMLVLTA